MNVMAALAKAGLLDMSKVLAAGASFVHFSFRRRQFLADSTLPRSRRACDETGDKKMMGITRLPDRKDALWRRLDIRVCPFGAHSYFLLGNTGDDNLMKILRVSKSKLFSA